MIEPEKWIKAHQYLYYIKGITVWDDQRYDQFCKEHNIFGGGGSDMSSSYDSDVIRLANRILDVHNKELNVSTTYEISDF